MPKCFTAGDEAALPLLKVTSSDFWLLAFLEKYSSRACLFRSRLNYTSIEKPSCLLTLNVCLKLHERHVYEKLCKKGRYHQQIFYSSIQGCMASHLHCDAKILIKSST